MIIKIQFEGVFFNIEGYRETTSDYIREQIEKYMVITSLSKV